jgi:AraC family transcriptional regulator
MATAASAVSSDFRGEIVRRRPVPGFTIVDLRHRGPSRSGRHAHRLAYFSWLASGGYRERDGGSDIDFRSREGRLYPADYRHADEIGPSGARFLCVEIDDPGLILSGPTFCAASSEASRLAASLRLEMRRDDAPSALVLEGLALQLVGSIARFPLDRRLPRWLARVDERLREEDRDPARIADLAAEAGVHPAHLARSYRKHFHRTIGEALRLRRVEKARRLLDAGEPLSAAAADAGFSDQSHMSRAFRAFFGTSPGEYRRARFRPKG